MAFEGMATPLGMKPGTSRRGVPLFRHWGPFVLLAAAIATFILVTGFRHIRGGAVPGAVAIIERDSRGSTIDRSAIAVPAGSRQPGSDASRSGIAEIEADSGVNVIRQNGGNATAGMVIKVPDSAERTASGTDSRVSERSQFGILPRVGEGGLLPRTVYARPFAATEKPKISIVLTGVGIGSRGTTDAIMKLPGEVTLAFAPYGRDLENQVQRARREGHEILLQVPMEPLDYPESDPGPHTLKARATTRENIERLHWLMSRFTGYVGLTNFMGSKLTAETGAYGSLLDEISQRGLLFLDDGNSTRSRTAEIGRKIGLPARVADRIHDTNDVKSLGMLLSEAEVLARKNGSAILCIPALPANIDRISTWARELAGRGIVLAPVSANIQPVSR